MMLTSSLANSQARGTQCFARSTISQLQIAQPSSLTSGLVQLSFTNDREKLKDALLKLRSQPMGNETEKCPTITYYIADQILRGFRDAIASVTQELILCQSLTPQEARRAQHGNGCRDARGRGGRTQEPQRAASA